MIMMINYDKSLILEIYQPLHRCDFRLLPQRVFSVDEFGENPRCVFEIESVMEFSSINSVNDIDTFYLILNIV